MSSGWISKKQRQAIYSRDNHICCYCGKRCVQSSGNKVMMKLYNRDFATLDHVISRAELSKMYEGKELSAAIRNPSNLIVTCNGCNSSKKHVDLAIWCNVKGFNYIAIQNEIRVRTES